MLHLWSRQHAFGCLMACATFVIILTIVEGQKEWGTWKNSKYNWNCQQEQIISLYSEHLILFIYKENKQEMSEYFTLQYFCLLHHRQPKSVLCTTTANGKKRSKQVKAEENQVTSLVTAGINK